MSKTASTKMKRIPEAKRVIVFGESDWFDQQVNSNMRKQIKRN